MSSRRILRAVMFSSASFGDRRIRALFRLICGNSNAGQRDFFPRIGRLRGDGFGWQQLAARAHEVEAPR